MAALMEKRIQVVCVLGNWSSGTTAVTGYLDHLGAYSCPPHIMTNDPRTPNSYESKAFRDACAATIDELTFNEIGDRRMFCSWLSVWLDEQRQAVPDNGHDLIILKHPLSAFLISEILSVCQPKWIVVTRPFAEIEATRLRRKWFPTYGQHGAKVIYSTLFSGLIENAQTFYTTSFNDFRKCPQNRKSLLHFIDIVPSANQEKLAEDWVR